MPVHDREDKLRAELRRIGIVYPDQTIHGSRKGGIPLSALCAVLFMETGGGHNVYGHDPVRRGQAFGGHVTRLNYARYKLLRRLGFGNQGVGPMQLTSPGFQDQADAAGGCWKVTYNILTGARALAKLRSAHGSWRLAFQHYNGSGPAAEHYGHAAQTIMDRVHADFERHGLV